MTLKIQNSERLSYRLISKDDSDLLFELDQDEQVMLFLNGGRKTTHEEIRDIFMPRMLSYRNPEKGCGLWAVYIEDTGEYIGFILIRPYKFDTDAPVNDNMEMGWRFKRSTWGLGLALEAAVAVRNSISHLEHVKKFSAIASKENIASTKLMTKIGMSYKYDSIYKDPLNGSIECVYYEMDNLL